MKLSSKNIFQKFVHSAHGVYYYLNCTQNYNLYLHFTVSAVNYYHSLKCENTKHHFLKATSLWKEYVSWITYRIGNIRIETIIQLYRNTITGIALSVMNLDYKRNEWEPNGIYQGWDRFGEQCYNYVIMSGRLIHLKWQFWDVAPMGHKNRKIFLQLYMWDMALPSDGKI